MPDVITLWRFTGEIGLGDLGGFCFIVAVWFAVEQFLEEARMLTMADGKTYKSRLKVLVGFFRRSRDQWKEKCLAAKATLKKANNLTRWLEISRDSWKDKAKELEAEIQQLQAKKKSTV